MPDSIVTIENFPGKVFDDDVLNGKLLLVGLSIETISELNSLSHQGVSPLNFEGLVKLAEMIKSDDAILRRIKKFGVKNLVVHVRRYIDRVHITSCVLKYTISFGVNNIVSPSIVALIANGERPFIQDLWRLLVTAFLRALIISFGTSAGHFVLRSHSIDDGTRNKQWRFPDPKSNVGRLLKFLYFVVAYVPVVAVTFILMDLQTVRYATESDGRFRLLADFLTRTAMFLAGAFATYKGAEEECRAFWHYSPEPETAINLSDMVGTFILLQKAERGDNGLSAQLRSMVMGLTRHSLGTMTSLWSAATVAQTVVLLISTFFQEVARVEPDPMRRICFTLLGVFFLIVPLFNVPWIGWSQKDQAMKCLIDLGMKTR